MALIKYLIPIVFLVVASSLVAPASADFWDDVQNMEIFKIKNSVSACPVPLVGPTMCPESTALYYFKCCGDLNANCCFRLQDWAVAIISIMVILIVAGIFINLIRCICC